MGRSWLPLALAACTAPDPGDALAPRVDACEGGGGRTEALGTLAVSVGGEALRPWRAEVRVLPDGDRTEVETFACVLADGAQVATWSVAFRLPDRVDGALALTPSVEPGVDGYAGTLALGEDAPLDLGADGGRAAIERYDATVGELRGTLTAPSAEVDAAFDVRW